MAKASNNTIETAFQTLWDEERSNVKASGNAGLIALLEELEALRIEFGASVTELFANLPSQGIA